MFATLNVNKTGVRVALVFPALIVYIGAYSNNMCVGTSSLRSDDSDFFRGLGGVHRSRITLSACSKIAACQVITNENYD